MPAVIVTYIAHNSLRLGEKTFTGKDRVAEAIHYENKLRNLGFYTSKERTNI